MQIEKQRSHVAASRHVAGRQAPDVAGPPRGVFLSQEGLVPFGLSAPSGEGKGCVRRRAAGLLFSAARSRPCGLLNAFEASATLTLQ